ncbi:hypothetical protein N0V90_002904 [Kalmusia sp. IMI 367209]|nr:hypothetical protein N0V90_002904 [Kalmusia sp. IMI 367209]
MRTYTFVYTAISLLSITLCAQSRVTTTPAGCRKLKTDVDWPSHAQWEAALPGVIATNGSDIHGPLPNYRLQAKSVEDVRKAVRFAKDHNIRLSVLTTGHDQMLRSDAGSGLLIDLSLFQGSRVMPAYTATTEGLPFVGIDAEAEPIKLVEGEQAAVSFGPALAGLPLNYAVSKSGLFTVSGGAATVAVGGGWGQNGGYGPMTSQYGLGVDQWLEALIVTPDGELRVANSAINSDLFWAIRGGGGSTFGVVVQATWKAHVPVPMTGYNWYINSTLEASELEPGTYATSEALRYLLGSQSGISNANKIWGPILSNVSSLPGITPFQTRAFEFSSYREFFEGTYGTLVPQPTTADHRYDRGIVPYDSRLLSAEHLVSPNITQALAETGGSLGVQIMSPGSRFGNGSSVSANPGWRKAAALIIAFKTNTTSADGLRRLAPDMGTYINEASVTEPNWSSSFWGSNYARLSELKRKYDPEMRFWVSPGINADYMQAKDGRACMVDPIPSTPSEYPPPTDRRFDANITADAEFLFGHQELTGSTFPRSRDRAWPTSRTSILISHSIIYL